MRNFAISNRRLAERKPFVGAKRRWIKAALQVAVLALVVWGITNSVRKSAAQLSRQQRDLADQALELRMQAEQAGTLAERTRLLEASEQIGHSAKSFWHANSWGLVSAGVLYALGMLPASLFWRQCLAALDQPTHGLSILWAYFYGNLGKYFPGKAMVIVLRLSALDRLGIKKTATSITIFMETLTMMSVGGAMAAICLILLNLDWRLTLLAVALLLLTFAPTFPPLLRYLLPKLQRGVDAQLLDSWAGRINARLFARGWCLLSLTWLAFGLSLLFVLRSLPIADFTNASPTSTILSCFGACGLAVVLGFVSLIPGGAGVREAVLSVVLTPVVGPVAALCGAIWLRIVWLATELTMVGLLFVLKSLLPKPVLPLQT
jgi:uncharacterized membrane protein YbhN (UPF0104 family)